MRYTLEQLRVLEAIDRLGSFSGAAKELHRATSAISYAVRALEEALDVEIFDRTGHRASLTPAGELVLGEGRALLEQARRIELLAGQLHAGWEPRLLIIVDGMLPLNPAMRSLKRFIAEEIPTVVQLRVEYLSRVRERFEAEGADLMVTLDETADIGWGARTFEPVEMVLCVHAEHALAQQPGPIRRTAFHPYVELLVAPAALRGLPVVKPLFLGGERTFEVSDFHAKREALLEGIGFGWMPRHLVASHLQRGELVSPPLEEGTTRVFTPRLVYRSEKALGRGATLFAQFLEEEFAVQAGMTGTLVN